MNDPMNDIQCHEPQRCRSHQGNRPNSYLKDLPILSFQKLKTIANSFGLGIFVITDDLAPLRGGEKALREWQEAGYGASMEYMSKDARILSQPASLLPEGKSALLFSVFYDQTEHTELKEGYGRVARYAWGKDYHKVLAKLMKGFVTAVRGELPPEFELLYRTFSDAVPLLERAFAARSGVGFVGKNTMLIRPGSGSLFLLAGLLWNLKIEDAPPLVDSSAHCGSCTRCLNACPTNAFAAPHVLNAGKCISYLSIEKRGALNEWEREALGEWIFGCDICQEVCPFNHASLRKEALAAVKALSAESGVGQSLNLSSVLAIRTKQEFEARFGGTPIMRAKREGLLRNAACVAVNTGSCGTISALEEAVRSDESELIRETALWALSRLSADAGSKSRVRALKLYDTFQAQRKRRVDWSHFKDKCL